MIIWIVLALVLSSIISFIAYGLLFLGIASGFISLMVFLWNIFGFWGGMFILIEGFMLLILAPPILLNWDKEDKGDDK